MAHTSGLFYFLLTIKKNSSIIAYKDLKDSKGHSKTSTINVKTSEEPFTMNVDDSFVDSSLCVNLVKGLAYMDYSRLGVRVKVSHTHALKTVKVTINGRENTLKNIDQYASEFTFIDSNKIEKVGDVVIGFYAVDVNGREDSHSITYKTYKIIEPPVKPTIKYEVTPGLFLSEGEKIVFSGESADISNYQVIYALESCDVINATSFCNNHADSYMHDKGTLTSNLNNNASGTIRYCILKDFGVDKDATIVTYDSNNSRKFHIHPQEPDHINSRFYALQFLKDAKPGDKIYISKAENTTKIIKLRKEHGLSQEDLGNAINVSRQAITKWESGEGTPDIDNLI